MKRVCICIIPPHAHFIKKYKVMEAAKEKASSRVKNWRNVGNSVGKQAPEQRGKQEIYRVDTQGHKGQESRVYVSNSLLGFSHRRDNAEEPGGHSLLHANSRRSILQGDGGS